LFLLQTTCRKLAKVSKSTENLGNKSAKTLTPQSHGTIQTSDWRNARQPKLSQKSDIKNSYTTKQAIGAMPASRNCRKKATSKTHTQPNKRLAQCPPAETVAKKRHQKLIHNQTSDWRNARQPKLLQKSDIKNAKCR